MKAFLPTARPMKAAPRSNVAAKSKIDAVDFDYGFKGMTGRRTDGSRDFKLLPKTGDIPDGIVPLSLENFDRELRGLRKFTRLGDSKLLEAKAKTWWEKAGWAVNRPIIEAFSRLDEMLEADNVLPKLDVLKLDEDSVEVKDTTGKTIGKMSELREKLASLKLSDEGVIARDRARYEAGQARSAPWFINAIYTTVTFALDALFKGRPIQRFWFLEVVARQPYFSYITCLHLYESLGWFRAGAELRKIHFGEEYNELNHLLIMESLGGDQLWSDRFLAEHAAVIYYWLLVLLYFYSPKEAYNFMALLEGHAGSSYGQFLDDNEELLKSLPPTKAALDYYMGADMYIFDLMDPLREQPRRPEIKSLYDVFYNIMEDEATHVKIMSACSDRTIMDDLVKFQQMKSKQ